MPAIDVTKIDIDMDLTFISLFTLKVLIGILFQSFWNVVNNVFCWWNAAFGHILVFVVLAVMRGLRDSSRVLFGHCLIWSLWDTSMIALLVLVMLIDIRDWPLAPALFDTLVIFWGATVVELLDRVVLLKGSYILSMLVLGRFVCGGYTWSWSALIS